MRAILVAIATVAIMTNTLAQSPTQSADPLARQTTSFDLIVHLPLEQTAPLFGPLGELAWAGGHWNPEFIYPQPAHDQEGAVFSIHHGPYTATWVCTAFDLDARHFQYVYFLPGLMVTTIDVHFKPVDANGTAVNVIYTRTAIAPEGNAHVAAMSDGDKNAGAEWQLAIDEHLAKNPRYQSHSSQTIEK
jgi:hypothetical protein